MIQLVEQKRLIAQLLAGHVGKNDRIYRRIASVNSAAGRLHHSVRIYNDHDTPGCAYTHIHTAAGRS